MNSTLTIPKLCKVGFNPRTDTYTGKLGYVIYNDGKVWRKETSWLGWIYNVQDSAEFERQKLESFNASRQSSIDNYERVSKETTDYYKQWLKSNPTLEGYLKQCRVDDIKNYHYHPYRITQDVTLAPFEFENEPLEGFVLNKKAGGYSSGWNHRQSYIRVYDPRGFEFEITPENLLYILEHTNSIVGKGLEGKFVYSWCGKDLVLLPADAPEYAESIKYSTFVKQKVSNKTLQVGGVYLDSQKQKLVYLTKDYCYDYYGVQSANQQYWFARLESKDAFSLSSIGTIKEFTGEILDDTTDFFEKLVKNRYYTPKAKFVPEYIPATKENLIKHFGEFSADRKSELLNSNYLYIKNKNSGFKKVSGSYSTYSYNYNRRNSTRGYPIIFRIKDTTTKQTQDKSYSEIEQENKYFIKLKKQI